MRYRGSLTIPAGTTEESPATAVLELCSGVISNVRILHPAGQAGLVHVTVWRHTRQIYPTTPGQSFIGDDQQNVFDERWPILEVPHEVELRGWAPSATLEHTVYVEVSVIPPPKLHSFNFSVDLPPGV